jgi:CysZ protein
LASGYNFHTAEYDRRKVNPFYHAGWGIKFFLSGLRMLMRHPALLGLSLIPMLITVVLFVLLVAASAWLVRELIADTISRQMLLLAQILIVAITLLIGYFLYLPIARVLFAPFSETLSRKTHTINTGGSNYQSSLGWGRAMREGLKLVIFQIAIVLIALALSLILPPIGAPFGIAMAVFTCGLDFFDVPLSARGMPFRKKLGVIWRNRSLAIGFGIAAYLSLLIPVLNLLSLPVGVIGATLLTDALERDKGTL